MNINELPCWECPDGVISKRLKEFQYQQIDGAEIIIPNVPTWVCSLCGAESFCKEGSAVIESFRFLSRNQKPKSTP
jgi:YgiT-type zinc finger domain-containing protein